MLYLLTIRPPVRWTFILAAVAAVAASFSSFQGLFLWPLGLICLVWTPRSWSRGYRILWISVAVVTTGIYFIGYQSNPQLPDGLFSGVSFGLTVSSLSPLYALGHPLLFAQMLLVTVGNAVPLSWNPQSPWSNEVIGAVLIATSAYVVTQCVRERQGRAGCLPVILIGFGFALDAAAEIGRVKFGLPGGAFVSRYSMGSLLVVVGILTYGWAHVLARHVLAAVGLGAFLVLQVIASTNYGITQSEAYRQSLVTGAQLAVNEQPLRGCDAFLGVSDYHLPTNLSPSFVASMKADRLNLFSPGAIEHYRAEGLPKLAPCPF